MPPVDDEFRVARWAVKINSEDVKGCAWIYEATSKNNAMGWFFLAGRSFSLGSHTHVQTATKNLEGGTAYHRCRNDGEAMPELSRWTRKMSSNVSPNSCSPCRSCKGDVWICAVVIEIEETGRQIKLEASFRAPPVWIYLYIRLMKFPLKILADWVGFAKPRLCICRKKHHPLLRRRCGVVVWIARNDARLF